MHEHTSVNAVIREYLAAWVRDESDRAVLVDLARSAMEGSEYRSGGVAWTRDELHDR